MASSCETQRKVVDRCLGVHMDKHSRPYQIIAGERVHYIDYTLFLHNDVATLKEFVCTADMTDRQFFFIARREWIDRKLGIVYAPTHVLPKLSGDALERLCEQLARDKVSMSTVKFHFGGQNRTIIWRPYPLKGVYADAGEL